MSDQNKTLVHESIQQILQDVTIPTKEQEAQQIEPEKNSAADTGNKDDDGSRKPEVQPISKEMLEASADTAIAMFDFVQDNLFSVLARRKKRGKMNRLYGDDSADRLEKALNKLELQQQGSKGNVEIIESFTADELGMMRLERDFNDHIADLALTEKEIAALKPSLMELMKTRGGTIPPEYMLMLAVIQITGARITETVML
jgi:hypothetical protein